jgi:hypothetical protein
MAMEPASGQRNGAKEQAKEQYANMRRSLTAFEERIVGRYLDEDTLARTSFERFLGSLDRLAGWLLNDDEISHRGQALTRQTGHPAIREEAADTTGEERGGTAAAEQIPVPDEQADEGGLADVTFTFPADVQAGSVVLCGEFNQWSVEGIPLDRGDDGIWRAVVALEPGRSYRYRYLIDGERWVNAPGADQYVPNPYGSLDSVLSVEPPTS